MSFFRLNILRPALSSSAHLPRAQVFSSSASSRPSLLSLSSASSPLASLRFRQQRLPLGGAVEGMELGGRREFAWSRVVEANPQKQTKLKSHSSSKKRFFANAKGMFKRAQAGKAHLNTPLSSSSINRLAKGVRVTTTQARKLRKLLPFA
ncbi:ribosomal protein L35 [Cryptococcus wingfieldii CBS 7118]|uniref:Ribosomal protein L35 n=1 Tax=Cryptococcus wingfieldii CBS 7118 TaxID=1295528 RepID=A0A1E3IP71_9TREE|nr:ribosomal protein L35 [Cryptococcus wingfieldii CBS 7118]ODN89726.1 ribosomal protein L35 [Cryptococcus wingfieldii CBS 7118]